ncbi:unnamed protein product [Rhizoctonia solani]|uniref:Uncharacterized protein n=1 Tax=Rhizoctonia solani TaxID=456999 RepID=A0A8H3HN96_9AGAM|nr:unnamed protein product [Rhizoctonia solani]
MASFGGSVDAAPKPFRGPWEGESKIVIGIDIGTTQSGVAFTFLQTGKCRANQAIHRVTKWPGQEIHSSKIPTLVWYDTSKKAVSFGAEALLTDVEERAEDNNWFLAKHFKLHLHPDDMKAKHNLKLDALPPGVNIKQIYTDFLRYLLKYTKEYFEDRILDGKSIWERYSPDMEVVIAHPNGWFTREQVFLRGVAVDAGFSTSEKAQKNIRFLTEAEASVHFCIHHTNLGDRLKSGTNFVVCDAGGSTVDTTLYCVTSAHPTLKLEEKRASACVQAGAIFVDLEAERHLRKILSSVGLSEEDIKDYTKAGMKDFEAGAKRGFQDEAADQYITVGNSRFNNSSIRARRGRLTLSGTTMKSFFDICTDEIISSVDQQIDGLSVPHILLVGGMGDSPYLRNRFKERYEPRGSQITRTNDSTSKAVADGAVIWSIVSSVSSRAPRYSFGAICARIALPWVSAGRKMYLGAHGLPVIPGAWSQVVHKGVALDTEAVCKETYSNSYRTANPDLKSLSMDLYAYPGDDEPDWAWDEKENPLPIFRKVCTISADLRGLEGALERKVGLRGSEYWELEVAVCMRFGGTELEAYLEWTDKAVSFGAEALSPQAEDDAEDNEWQLAKHFKLHLHPVSMRNEHGLALDPLPHGISLLRVYSDFLGYLIRHTQSFFEDRIVDGKLLWQKHRTNMQFIIAHPNGFGVREQSFLRVAATNAGLVTNATAASCVRFVTEAEASVHFCIYHTNLGSRLQPGMKFAVCDAGGSTVDTTVYSVLSTRQPLELEEAHASACVQAGAIFVNAAAEKYIQRTLKNASLPQDDVFDYTKRGIQDFEKNLKRQFAGDAETGSKAVADGAIIWSTTSNVTGRAPRSSFGIETSVRFNSVNADHQGREVITCPSGTEKVSGIWSQIAAKGVVIDARAVARESFSKAFNTPHPDLNNFEISLISYSNNGEPMWARDKRGLLANGFQNCCTISANLANMSGALEPRIGVNGNKYWRLYFEVCIRFGGTELEAYLEWEERGTTRTGSVTIVPDDPIEEKAAAPTRETITSEKWDDITSREAIIPVLIFGHFESPRAEFVDTACAHMETKPESKINSSDVTVKHAVVEGHPFKLVNAPGFDNPHKSNPEVFMDIIQYLQSGEVKAGIKGALYVHRATDTLYSRALAENMNVLFNLLLGQAALRLLTILIVLPDSKDTEYSASIIAKIQAPDSAFSAAHKAGARIVTSTLEEGDVFDVLKHYATNDSVQLQIQRDRPANIQQAIEQALGYSDTNSVNASLARLEKSTTDRFLPDLIASRKKCDAVQRALEQTQQAQAESQRNAERYYAVYQQTEAQLGAEQKRVQDLARRLQETQSEYSSLRSQLQIQENVEQSEIVLGLKDLNRAIEDIGRAFSTYFADNYASTAFEKDVLDVTTLDARDPMALQMAFGHVEGDVSFVKSSSGGGMMVEDFFDYGIRHLLCGFLWQRIFHPFHPGINDSFDQLLAGIYQDIQRREPQTVAAKWRVNTFNSLNMGENREQARDAVIANHAKEFCEGIKVIAQAFFGQDVQLEANHLAQIDNLLQMAWAWNAILKGEVIVLGDFVQIYFEPRLALDPNIMDEFEPWTMSRFAPE